MEFEDRCHKVQEPKFECLLFGKATAHLFSLQNVAVHAFRFFLSVFALLLPLSLHGMQKAVSDSVLACAFRPRRHAVPDERRDRRSCQEEH
jgi:hypothetical protein